MSIFLQFILSISFISISVAAFAAPMNQTSIASSGASSETGTTISTSVGISTGSGEAHAGEKQEEEKQKKDKEKTINDINTFLIESYKMKIDKILENLNINLERVTNNDPIAQGKLLEKIRNDVSQKIQVMNSRTISENRKKILSSVFSYIQENLDAKISKLAQEK